MRVSKEPLTLFDVKTDGDLDRHALSGPGSSAALPCPTLRVGGGGGGGPVALA